MNAAFVRRGLRAGVVGPGPRAPHAEVDSQPSVEISGGFDIAGDEIELVQHRARHVTAPQNTGMMSSGSNATVLPSMPISGIAGNSTPCGSRSPFILSTAARQF